MSVARSGRFVLKKDDNKTKDKDLDARYAYLGLSHAKYGELIAGRTKNPLYQVMRMTDKYKKLYAKRI